jgi:hypothetical protein
VASIVGGGRSVIAKLRIRALSRPRAPKFCATENEPKVDCRDTQNSSCEGVTIQDDRLRKTTSEARAEAIKSLTGRSGSEEGVVDFARGEWFKGLGASIQGPLTLVAGKCTGKALTWDSVLVGRIHFALTTVEDRVQIATPT